MGVGLRLKSILRYRKMTIKQLAEITGISLNTLYSITKRDTINVDTATLQKIANALNVSLSDILWNGEGPIPDDVDILVANPKGVSIVDPDRFAQNSLRRSINYEIQTLITNLNIAEKDDLFIILEYISKATDVLRERKQSIHQEHLKKAPDAANSQD